MTRLFYTLSLIPFFTLRLSAQDEAGIQFDLEDIICKEQVRAEAEMNMTSSRNYAGGQSDIYYQEMHWDVDPAVFYIKGEIKYYFKSKVPNLTQLILDLTNSLQVNYIRRGAVDLAYVHTPDQLLTIDLGKELVLDEIDSLTISYEGMPPSNGSGSFEQSTHNEAPIIWTLSEPYGVRDWWPGKQDLVDKIDSIDVYITTPLNNLAAGNGKLISITEDTGKLVHHWQHRHPIASYLIALAVTNYAAYSNFVPLANGDSVEILNYVYPENLTTAQSQTTNAVDIMDFYNRKFIVYPFADEKYGHAQFGWGGGMEHQTMSFMYNFNYSLMAHEMAHQWFGDKVTCGSWSDIWLNESFATYLTGLTYEEFSPDQYWPLWKSSTSNSATSQPGGSVFVDDTTNVNRIFSSRLSYNKGSYVLHMMRWVTGDDHFFEACKKYLTHAGTAFDFGSTRELQNYMEAESGQDLNEFLADWYYGQGYPSYHIHWAQVQDSLIIEVNQAQSDPSVSFFEMPVPVWAFNDGVGQQIVLPNTEQDQTFKVYVGSESIDSLQFDPERWILSRDNTVFPYLTGIDIPAANGDYSFYPNPASDFIEINPKAELGRITLINAQGLEFHPAWTDHKVSLDHFPDGFYTMMMENTKREVKSIQPLLILH